MCQPPSSPDCLRPGIQTAQLYVFVCDACHLCQDFALPYHRDESVFASGFAATEAQIDRQRLIGIDRKKTCVNSIENVAELVCGELFVLMDMQPCVPQKINQGFLVQCRSERTVQPGATTRFRPAPVERPAIDFHRADRHRKFLFILSGSKILFLA